MVDVLGATESFCRSALRVHFHIAYVLMACRLLYIWAHDFVSSVAICGYRALEVVCDVSALDLLL